MYAVLEKSLYDTEYSENTNTQPSDDSDSERQADDDYYITNVLAPLEINFHFDRYFDSGDTKVTHIPIRLHCPPPNIS
ncbi:hypothetical protein GCM10011418_32510 [Sphingobacterium alkalisoli]|nr:hypothetical protein GCM10011418_32510 [Sphingobacterium alkalisoli]